MFEDRSDRRIAEIIDLAGALDILGIREITLAYRNVLLPLIAKTRDDRKKLLMKEAFECLVQEGIRFKQEILDGTIRFEELDLR